MEIVCSRCRKPYVEVDQRRGFLDHLLHWVYLYPYGCRVCRHRFHVMQWGFRPMDAAVDRDQSRSRPVQIRATLMDERGERDGTITDLSAAGCVVEIMPPLLEQIILGIRLNALDDNPPIVVEAAIVRSSLGSRAELEFLRLAPKEQERLNEFILSLWIEGTQIARSSGRWKTSSVPSP